jgi:hypothetical protein
MEFLATPQTQTGWIERTKIANPTTASDWACYPTYTAVHFYGVKMISSSEIWLVGEKGTIITTRNAHGGIISASSEPDPQKEWFGNYSGTLNDLFDIESLDQNTLIAVGKNGTIIRTFNAQNLNYLGNTASIITSSITNLNSNSATCGGNVIVNGSTNVTNRGVCWSTSPNPTTSNSTTTNGTGIGTFTSSITGLIPGTTYYVRAYAVNSIGTSYGNQIKFIASNGPTGFELISSDNFICNVKPNPSNGIFKLTFPYYLKNAIIKVISPEGKLVSSSKVNGDEFSLDLTDFSNGIYFVNLTNGKLSWVGKIIKY